MKKTMVTLLALLALCTILTHGSIVEASMYQSESGTSATIESKDGIVLEPWEPVLFVGESVELKASGAESILWSSSDPSIVTVDEQGLVTAIAPGEATITACSAQDSSVRVDIEIVVGIHTEAVQLEEKELTLLAGSKQDEYELVPQIMPETALIKEVVYTSSNENFLTVDENGRLHAVAPGTAIVTVSSLDKECKTAAQVRVTVKQGVTGVELNKTEAELYLNEKTNLTAKVLPLNAANKKCVWSSSDESVAEVNQNGAITPKGEGKTLIRCAAEEDSEVFSECEVNVTIGAQKIVLDTTAATLLLGGPKESGMVQLKYTVSPDDTSFKTVTWTSSDEKIATVDENGLVRGVSAGRATITAITTDSRAANRVKATCNVTVGNAVTTIQLSKTKAELYLNESLNLTSTILPQNAINKKCIWSSSNESVATVNQNGGVSAKSEGKTMIRCTAEDNSEVFSECEVDVTVGAQKVVLDTTSVTLLLGGSDELKMVQLKHTVSPENTSFKTVTWTSSDEKIATVDEAGLVRGVSAGRATITATTTDSRAANRVKATCLVTVGNAVTNIVLDGVDSRIQKGQSKRLIATINPEKPFNNKLSWSSSNEDVLKVDVNGNIRAINVGTATITVSATDGSLVSTSEQFTVYQPVAQIRPSSYMVAVSEEKTIPLAVSVLPEDATNKTIEWRSDDTSIATVDKDGKITGIKQGTCTIIGTASDGSGKNAKISVTVEPKVPLSATRFTRSGYFGMYYEFAVTFKNLTKSRTIKYISFDVKYNYQGTTYTLSGCYTKKDVIYPGAKRKVGWWDNIGYRLTYCNNFQVYLRSVQYSDGTWDYFNGDSTLIGWFVG